MKSNKKSVHGLSRPIWQRLGVLVIGLCALLGVANAGNIQKMITASTAGSTDSKLAAQTVAPISTVNSTSPVVEEAVETHTSGAPNIVDLVADSEIIIRGMVKETTDGFENGVPYTQVTVSVTEKLRGQVGDEYTFRQFGLKEPRSLGNGKVYLGTTPEGWSKYEVGEDAMLFLYQQASMTGLRTTTGLGQGKVVFKGGNAVSQAGNEGLFENVEVSPNLVNEKDKRLLATKKGEVNGEGFMSFVRRAVKDKWVEGGKLRHAKK